MIDLFPSPGEIENDVNSLDWLKKWGKRENWKFSVSWSLSCCCTLMTCLLWKDLWHVRSIWSSAPFGAPFPHFFHNCLDVIKLAGLLLLAEWWKGSDKVLVLHWCTTHQLIFPCQRNISGWKKLNPSLLEADAEWCWSRKCFQEVEGGAIIMTIGKTER